MLRLREKFWSESMVDQNFSCSIMVSNFISYVIIFQVNMVISDAFPILNYVTQFSHIWSDMIFTGLERCQVKLKVEKGGILLTLGVVDFGEGL